MSDVIKLDEKGVVSYEKISCSYKWTILDFKNRTITTKKGDSLNSDRFEIYEPDGRNSNWSLQLYPKGYAEARTQDLSLCLKSLNNFEINICFTFSIIDASTGTKQINQRANNEKFKNSKGHGYSVFCKEKTLQDNPQWLDGGNLTIVCDIEILSNQENNIAPLTKRRDQLCKDFSKLFTDSTASDVKIKCGTIKHFTVTGAFYLQDLLCSEQCSRQIWKRKEKGL